MEQALRQIGRDDVVHRMHGLSDTAGGLPDAAEEVWRSRGGTPVIVPLRRDHSSKGSLAAGAGLAFAAAPTSVLIGAQTLSATRTYK